MSKLADLEEKLRKQKFTGRMVLIVAWNQGGIIGLEDAIIPRK